MLNKILKWMLVMTVLIYAGCATEHRPHKYKYKLGQVVYFRVNNNPAIIVRRDPDEYWLQYPDTYGKMHFMTVEEFEITDTKTENK